MSIPDIKERRIMEKITVENLTPACQFFEGGAWKGSYHYLVCSLCKGTNLVVFDNATNADYPGLHWCYDCNSLQIPIKIYPEWTGGNNFRY